MNWKKINSFLRLDETTNCLDVTEDNITTEMIDFIISYMAKYDIRGIGFGSPFSKNQDISFITQLPGLQKLGIAYKNFNSQPVLKCLDIDELNIWGSFSGFVDFSAFSKLEVLSINYNNPGAPTVLKCTNLKQLFLVGYNEDDMEGFEDLSGLEKLTLSSPKISSLHGVEKLTSLKKLKITNARKLEDISSIENLLNLEELEINGCRKIVDFVNITYLKNIKVLLLNNVGVIESIGFIINLKNLEKLYLAENTKINDGDLSSIEALYKNELKEVFFNNRRHYSHKVEDFGFVEDELVKALRAKYR